MMYNLTMKYQHEEEIAALKAEIERLKKKLLDTQIDRGIKANELQRLVALSCKWAKQGHFFRSRAQLSEAQAEIERLESENGYLLAQIEGAKREIIQREDNYRKSVAEIERLREECKDVDWLREEYQKLIRENTRRGQIMVFCRARAAAWKRCAKRWRGIIRMWPKGLVSAPELEIKLKNLPSSPEDKSALDETNQKPGSTEL